MKSLASLHPKLSPVAVSQLRILPSHQRTLASVINHSTYVKPDVLVIGSGAAALTASLRAKSYGLSPLIIEKCSKFGAASGFPIPIFMAPAIKTAS